MKQLFQYRFKLSKQEIKEVKNDNKMKEYIKNDNKKFQEVVLIVKNFYMNYFQNKVRIFQQKKVFKY